MEQIGVQFYKLNRRKRYGVEGTQIRIGEAILLGAVLCFFWALTIAFIVINSADLFHDTQITVFACVFTMILLVITALVFRGYYPAFKRIRHARTIVKNNTLTDGTVTDVSAERVQRYSSKSFHSYYAVFVRYTFNDTDGELRYGEHSGNYPEIPFCKGQNLMIAFNKTDSVIINKFTLLDGAEEFARAEAEREQVDFSGIKGKPLKVDTSKPIGIADYNWSLAKIIKHENRLKRILSSSPSFTVGRMFVKKTTYRRSGGNKLFYCYIDGNGGQHVEECAGICGVNDGDDVTVAYSDTESEIITNYTLKKR